MRGPCKACTVMRVDREGTEVRRRCATVPSCVPVLCGIFLVFAVGMAVVDWPYDVGRRLLLVFGVLYCSAYSGNLDQPAKALALRVSCVPWCCLHFLGLRGVRARWRPLLVRPRWLGPFFSVFVVFLVFLLW